MGMGVGGRGCMCGGRGRGAARGDDPQTPSVVLAGDIKYESSHATRVLHETVSIVCMRVYAAFTS